MTSLDIGYVPNRPVESRDSLADRIIAARLKQAEGTVGVGATAAVELAAGLWERAFLSATCPALSVQVRGMMARALLLRGEFVAFAQPGMATLPAYSWDIHGRDTDPAGWRYRLTLPQPDSSRTIVRAGASRVLHVRIGCRLEAPWMGRSPLEDARGTRQLLELLESRMADEASMPVGAIVPVPKPSDTLAADVAALRGRVLLGETMAGGWGAGESARAYRDWEARRVGPDVPAANVELWRRVQAAVLSAAGVPGDLVEESGAGFRESWRRFLHSTIAPIGMVVEGELERLGMSPPTCTFDRLFASDLQGRARAMGSMVQAGISPASAARICGFEDADIAPPERQDIGQ